MMSSSTSELQRVQALCPHCNWALLPGVKFCGRCGAPTATGQSGSYPAVQARTGGYPAQAQSGGYPAQAQSGGYPAQAQSGGYPAQAQSGGYPAQAQSGGYPAQTPQFVHAPSFATVSSKHLAAPNPKLQKEAGKLMVMLARERIFLYLHWTIAFIVQAIGFWIAIKCYNDYIGDELTRVMMASTPLLYINSTGLICIVPIRGTRNEISRLSEKLKFLRFQIEYNHLL